MIADKVPSTPTFPGNDLGSALTRADYRSEPADLTELGRSQSAESLRVPGPGAADSDHSSTKAEFYIGDEGAIAQTPPRMEFAEPFLKQVKSLKIITPPKEQTPFDDKVGKPPFCSPPLYTAYKLLSKKVYTFNESEYSLLNDLTKQ